MEDREFVEILYAGLLGRPPDAVGRQNFVSALKNGADPRVIYAQIYNSSEFSERERKINSLSNVLGQACVTNNSVARLPANQSKALRILGRLVPMDVIGFEKVRVGRDNDGGYVMIDDFEGIVGAYSLGISDDVSWDREIADRGIGIFQYDHTIDRLPEEHHRFKWSKLKISDCANRGQGITCLPDELIANGHSWEEDYILKCDIEGEEWDVFAAIDIDLLKIFRQIVCEFHHLGEISIPEKFERMYRTVCNLTTHHSAVHVHGNNCARWAVVGGVAVPDVLEVTFIRNENKEFKVARDVFPCDLDQPNCPHFADFMLGSFRFGAGHD